jgi:hypothetical protein
VRLRDVSSGRIVDVKRTDSTGAFAFDQLPAGDYVAEVLDDDGHVIAVGQPVSVSGQSAVETMVRLPAKTKGNALLFSNAAAAIIAAAAAIGFAAWAQTGQAVSPQR